MELKPSQRHVIKNTPKNGKSSPRAKLQPRSGGEARGKPHYVELILMIMLLNWLNVMQTVSATQHAGYWPPAASGNNG